jgi:hypothetical protein
MTGVVALGESSAVADSPLGGVHDRFISVSGARWGADGKRGCPGGSEFERLNKSPDGI